MKTSCPVQFAFISTMALLGSVAMTFGCSKGGDISTETGGKSTSTGGVGGTLAKSGGAVTSTGGNQTSGGAMVTTGGKGGVVGTGGTSNTGGTTTGGIKTGGSPMSGGTVTGSGGVSISGGAKAGGTTGGASVAGGTPASGGVNTGGTTVANNGGAISKGGSTGNTGNGGSTSAACSVPQLITWTSTDPIIKPISDSSHKLTAVKDPSVVRYNDKWHVFASSVSTAGAYNLVYTSFTDFANASSATLYYMDKTPGFDTYIAAPQVFYFTPQKKWYLIFQSGPPMYSTSDDISDPTKWTRPAAFYSAEPAIIKESGNGWLDYWIICDASNCHLFFSNTHGRWYRSKTSISSFPSGFGDPVIVMQETEGGRLYEASNVYKINGSNKYLALVEAFDSTSNWKRYFRSWTAENLEGPWTVLHSFGTAPFAGKQNVSFTGSAWTNDISHGEMIRAGYDEKMAIDACKMQYLYQGFDLNFDTSDWTAYNKIPWHLGLLTQK